MIQQQPRHQRGPWVFRGEMTGPWKEPLRLVWARSGESDVCWIPPNEFAEANGRLIAKAPELLSSLRGMLRVYGDQMPATDRENLECLIAEAEGTLPKGFAP